MRFLLNFLYYRRRVIIVILTVAAVFSLFMLIYGIPLPALLYSVAICAAVTFFAAVFDFIRFRAKFKRLRLLEKEILLTTDNLPACDSEVEEQYQELIKGLFTAKADLQTKADKRYENASEYFTLWVHQIKTPISAMDLLLQNESSEEAAELAGDLQRIEQYAEMALLFVQLDNDNEDFVFREQPLDPIIRKAVRRFSPQFIRKRLSLVYEPVDVNVLTDERWLSFVIGQVISNSLKYTRGGEVKIVLEEPGKPVLLIRDSGIGIAPEDLPRIFERGFSGANGRTGTRSTGVGLYLCRRVCTRLGVGISASSDCETGRSFTEIRLDLSKPRIDLRD